MKIRLLAMSDVEVKKRADSLFMRHSNHCSRDWHVQSGTDEIVSHEKSKKTQFRARRGVHFLQDLTDNFSFLTAPRQRYT